MAHQMTEKTTTSTFSIGQFVIITLITSVWVQASEVFRYLVIVRPEMQSYLSAVPEVASFTLPIFLIWGVWGTLLTGLMVFVFWLCAQSFGNNRQAVVISALVSWCFFFLLFWIGMANMQLSSWEFIVWVLPFALMETTVATFIASALYSKHSEQGLDTVN
ncbi:hypothetical protein A9Q99_25415 [Gammaproteobacteria bacterium 45_16_T64]|nr:hypothetical protein A9Q99_25415 [Gammaproteobacteria bacterium 45_16_T64]